MKGYTIQASIERLEKEAVNGSGGASSADQVSFNNENTDLTATNVQNAIVEINGRINHYSTDETLVGKWVDGSDLFSKTVTVPFSELATDSSLRIYSLATLLANKTLRVISGLAKSATYGICPLGGVCYRQTSASGTYWEFCTYYDSVAVKASVASDIDTIAPDITVTILYTKDATETKKTRKNKKEE